MSEDSEERKSAYEIPWETDCGMNEKECRGCVGCSTVVWDTDVTNVRIVASAMLALWAYVVV